MAHGDYLIIVRATAVRVLAAADNGVLPLWAASVRDLVKHAHTLAGEVERLGRYEQALAALARGRVPVMTVDELTAELLAAAQVSQAQPSQAGEGD